MVYANLINDYMFKRIFGSEECKDILMDFLNGIVGGQEIVDVDILNSENPGATVDDRKAVFDISCRSIDGAEFIVEMQCAPQEYFRDRALFYTSYPVQRQAALARKKYLDANGNAMGFVWDFQLHPVMFIGITDFAISHDDGWPADRYRSSYSIREDSTGEFLNSKLRFIFLELGRFSKSEGELETLADKWMYLFRHMTRLQTRPEVFTEKTFERLFDIAEFANFTPEQLKSYQNAEKMKYDFQNTVNYAEKKGREAGRAEGHAEGFAEGQAQGIAEVAGKMQAAGMSIEEITRLTGMSDEEVRQL